VCQLTNSLQASQAVSLIKKGVNVPKRNLLVVLCLLTTPLSQTLDFSGVGAHHQNEVTEQAIQTISSWAQNMLLHASLHWPDQEDLELWPFAVNHVVFLWNHIPRKDTSLSPIELFSGTSFPSKSHLQYLHVWGCPVFVLDPKIQDSHKLPKWHHCAWLGLFLGYSKNHSTSIGLIGNISTGFVSPKFPCST